MIKKITTIFLIFLLNITPVMARVGTPTFDFEIPDLFNNPDVPSGERKKDDGGLSGGAVTAITLGSIGGAALLGLGGWLYRRKVSQCLTAGCIQGAKNPLIPFCMERNADAEVYVRINNNYPYLKKALSLNEIHYCPDSQYLIP